MRVACVTYDVGSFFFGGTFRSLMCEGSSAENSPDGNTTNHKQNRLHHFPINAVSLATAVCGVNNTPECVHRAMGV